MTKKTLRPAEAQRLAALKNAFAALPKPPVPLPSSLRVIRKESGKPLKTR